MIGKYKDEYYYYVYNDRVSNIITCDNNKANDDFSFKNGYFYKKIQKKELSEIFDISFWVSYDAKINGIPKIWEIKSNITDINNNRITIQYSNGLLPGWEAVEKNVSIKTIDINDIESAKVIKKYYKKDNVDYINPIIEEVYLDYDSLIKYRKYYNKEFL